MVQDPRSDRTPRLGPVAFWGWWCPPSSAQRCRWQFGVSRGAPASAPCSLPQVFTRYGKCYTFNAGQDGKPRLITMKGGTGNGLEIMLDIQQDEYLPVWGETGNPPPQRVPAAPVPLPSHLPAPHAAGPRPSGSLLFPPSISHHFRSFAFLFPPCLCYLPWQPPISLDKQPSLVYK